MIATNASDIRCQIEGKKSESYNLPLRVRILLIIQLPIGFQVAYDRFNQTAFSEFLFDRRRHAALLS